MTNSKDLPKRGRFRLTPGQRGRPPGLVDVDKTFRAITEEPKNLEFRDTEASAEYARIAKWLLKYKRLSGLDVIPIHQLCEQWAMIANLLKIVLPEHYNTVCDTPKWDEGISPEVEILKRLAPTFLTSCIKFGMTPYTRQLDGSRCIPEEFRAEPRRNSKKLNLTEAFEQDWTEHDLRCPEWFPHAAMLDFVELRRLMSDLKMFTPLDVSPLLVTVGLFHVRQKMLKDASGFTIEHKDWGHLKPHPVTTMLAQYDQILDKYQLHFAMNPQARKKFNSQTDSSTVRLKIYLGAS
jgi:phage terminase small subunit